MDIGKVIKENRKKYGLTQEQLSEQLFITNKTVSNWETGKTTPDLDSLIRLAKLFHLSLDDLLLEGSDTVESITNKEKVFKVQRWGMVVPSISILILTTFITLNGLFPKLFTMFYGKYVMFVIVFFNFAMDYYVLSEVKKYNIKDYETRSVNYIKIACYVLFAIIISIPMVVDIIHFINRH